MITTILIVLVAVVVLIVIIAVLALHFLRADDSETFDDVRAESRGTRRSPADGPREPVSDGPGVRRPRHPEPARPQGREQWTNARPEDDRSGNYRNRDTGPRTVANDRRNGQPAASRPAAATARPARPAKAGAEAKANGWDSLSDVDYWAELSADKPQVGLAASAPASARPNGSARRGRDAKAASRPSGEGRSAQRADSGPTAGGPAPAGSLPVRPRSQPARGSVGSSAARAADPGQSEQFDARVARTAGYGNEPATQSLAALARLSGPQAPAQPRPDGGQRPASGQRSGPGSRPGEGPRSPGRRLSQPAGYPNAPVPIDDDPLTSPSFPAINASDSRSYRARRSSGAHSGPHTGPQAPAGRSGGFAEPTAQYLVQPRGSQPQTPSSPPPVANPYGSYVSTPPPTYGQPDGARHGGPATGYLPANGYTPGRHNGNGHNGNGHSNGYPTRDQNDGQAGYGGFDYQNLTYQDVDYQQARSKAGYPQQNQHSGQFDERGYGVPDLAYGQDGYQGYPGYGPGGR